MSEINVNTIKKADGTGSLTVPAESGTVVTTASPSLGRRNLIINGAMQVAQRGTSASGIGTGGYRTVDRFQGVQSGYTTHRVTYDQSTDAPDGFSNSYKVTTTVADSGLNYWIIRQSVEAQNLQHLKYGTSSAQSLTLSFWVKSSTTGTFGVHLYSQDGSRIIGSTYTINSANTWENKTVIFDGDVSGVITNDNGRGIDVSWMLHASASYTSSDNTSWGSYSTSKLGYGHTANDWATTTNATFQITGVQLEVGSVASSYEHRSYGEELAACQRYYASMNDYLWIPLTRISDNIRMGTYFFPQTMRATPSITETKNLDGITTFGRNNVTTRSLMFRTDGSADSVPRVESVQADAEL